MPGMTDQQQRDMEARFRADLAAARRERDELRARLESAETALCDAQESRFALIIQNEELGAELADLRARLESAEAALREMREQLATDDTDGEVLKRIVVVVDAALGAAGERSEG